MSINNLRSCSHKIILNKRKNTNNTTKIKRIKLKIIKSNKIKNSQKKKSNYNNSSNRNNNNKSKKSFYLTICRLIKQIISAKVYKISLVIEMNLFLTIQKIVKLTINIMELYSKVILKTKVKTKKLMIMTHLNLKILPTK